MRMHRLALNLLTMSLYEKDPVKAKEFLTNYSCMTAESAIDSWKKLGEIFDCEV